MNVIVIRTLDQYLFTARYGLMLVHWYNVTGNESYLVQARKCYEANKEYESRATANTEATTIM